MPATNRRAPQAVLPAVYRSAMRLTAKHGMRTLSRINHKLFPEGQVIRLATGGEFFVPPDPHFFGYIVEHERHVSRVIAELVEEGDVCVDVGANIGYFTMALADAAGTTGRVVAYEPESSNHATLAANAERARSRGLDVLAIEAAVSDHEGFVGLIRGEESTLHQTVDAGDSGSVVQEVACVRLDDDLPRRRIDGLIKFMKVDVEGHEVAVLRGAERLLRAGRIAALVVEVTPGEVAEEVGRFLESIGAESTCWLDGAWRSHPVAALPHRTDVLARF